MSKICDHCGNQLKDGAKFCNKCGEPVANITTPQNDVQEGFDGAQQKEKVFCNLSQSVNDEVKSPVNDMPNLFSTSAVYKIEVFQNRLNEIGDFLEHNIDLLDREYVENFRRSSFQIRNHINEIINTERNLRIGIVGGVKAGKSTFLNALIFNGKTVLPQASTPMTATLTRMVYSQQQYAKVFFQSVDEWQHILRSSKVYDAELAKAIEKYKAEQEKKPKTKIGGLFNRNKVVSNNSSDEITPFKMKQIIKENIAEGYRAAKELTDLAEQYSLDVDSYLGKIIEIELADDNLTILSDYVGSKGKYTPLVKYIELGLNKDFLKDIDIIDTPGLNDPIVSRSMLTKDFLAQCDVVLILSYTGQFLSAQDMQLISRTLPGEGIRHAVLIGSKFDYALRTHNSVAMAMRENNSIPLNDVWKDIEKSLNKAAENNIQQCLLDNVFLENSVVSKLKDSLPPYYISSWFYIVAKKIETGIPLNEDDEKSMDILGKRLAGFESSASALYNYANIDKVRMETLPKYKEEKESIVREKSQRFIIDKTQSIIEDLNAVRSFANNNLQDIQFKDKEEMERKIRITDNALESCRIQIHNIFSQCGISSNEKIRNLVRGIRGGAKSHANLEIETKSEQIEVKVEREGFFGALGDFLFGKQTRIKNINFKQARVSDAMREVIEYLNETENMIDTEIAHIINLEKVRKEIKTAILKAFKTSDTEFDANEIIVLVNLLLQRLVEPKVKLNRSEFVDNINNQFDTNDVRDEDVGRLEMVLQQTLENIGQKACLELENQGKEIENSLNNEADNFVTKVQEKLNGNVDQIRKLLVDREESIKKYHLLIEDIDMFIAKMKKDCVQ